MFSKRLYRYNLFFIVCGIVVLAVRAVPMCPPNREPAMLERCGPTVDARGIKPKGLKSSISKTAELSSWQSVIVGIKFKQLLRIVRGYQYLCSPRM